MARSRSVRGVPNGKILERLEQIVKILGMVFASNSELSLSERARMLKIAEIDDLTIAEILNTTPITIRTLLSGPPINQRHQTKRPKRTRSVR